MYLILQHFVLLWASLLGISFFFYNHPPSLLLVIHLSYSFIILFFILSSLESRYLFSPLVLPRPPSLPLSLSCFLSSSRFPSLPLVLPLFLTPPPFPYTLPIFLSFSLFPSCPPSLPHVLPIFLSFSLSSSRPPSLPHAPLHLLSSFFSSRPSSLSLFAILFTSSRSPYIPPTFSFSLKLIILSHVLLFPSSVSNIRISLYPMISLSYVLSLASLSSTNQLLYTTCGSASSILSH